MNSNGVNSKYSNFLLHQKLLEQSEKFPEKAIIEYYSDGSYKSYRYKDIHQLILLFADLLENIPGSINIAIISENRPEWICAYFAVLSKGLVNVPIDPQLTDPEIASILNDAEVKILFISAKYSTRAENFKSSVSSLKKIIIIDKILSRQAAEYFITRGIVCAFIPPNSIGEVFPRRYEIQPSIFRQKQKSDAAYDLDSIASLLYTSGTTAIPKGVMLSHRNFSSNCNSIKELGIITEHDTFLAILPFHHSYPFMATLLYPLLFGTKIIIAQTLKGEEILQIMAKKGVTILVGVPQLFKVMNDNIQSELKRIPYILRILGISLIRKKLRQRMGRQFKFFLSGGARLDKNVARNLFHLGLPVLEGYGLTETSPVVTMNPEKKPRIGSVGKPIPHVEIRIDQPDSGGIGEILIKGSNVMEGYYKKPQETQGIIKDGWFYSGDLGYIDKEGYLYITGRLKEVIVLSSGKNIYPEELESFYGQIPFIKEICIIGRPSEDDPKVSSSLWAIIYPDMDFFKKTGNVNIYESLNWALKAAVEKQPSYRRISGFTIAREEIPRTRLGKIKRYEVEKKYREIVIKQMTQGVTSAPLSSEDEKLAESELGKEIVEIVLKQLEFKRKISVNDHLELDLGIDSLGRVELLVGLEAGLKIKIPEQIMAESFTIKDLLLKIQDYIKTSAREPILAEKISWDRIMTEPPSPDLIRKIYLNQGWISYISTFFISKILYLVYKTVWSLKIYGRGNTPKNCPYIICSNHQSFLDGPMIACTIPFRDSMNLYFLGYRYYFELPVLKKIVRLVRIIPLDPAVNLVDALKASAYVLNKNKSLCIFPEGARTPDGNIQEFKKGIGILTKHITIPIVPVYIKGSYNAWPIIKPLPRPYPITIRYGRPVKTDELLKNGYQLGAKDDYTAISLGLHEEIINLSRK